MNSKLQRSPTLFVDGYLELRLWPGTVYRLIGSLAALRRLRLTANMQPAGRIERLVGQFWNGLKSGAN